MNLSFGYRQKPYWLTNWWSNIQLWDAKSSWLHQENHSHGGASDGSPKLVLKLYLHAHTRWPNLIELPVPLGSERDLSQFTSNRLCVWCNWGSSDTPFGRRLESGIAVFHGSPIHLLLSFHQWSSLCLDPAVSGMWMEKQQLPGALKHCNLAPCCWAAI